MAAARYDTDVNDVTGSLHLVYGAYFGLFNTAQ